MQGYYTPCPHCRNQLYDDGRFAGQLVQCPTCQRQFQMPVQAVPVSFPTGQPVQNPFAVISTPTTTQSRLIVTRPKPSNAPWIIAALFGVVILIGGIIWGTQQESKHNKSAKAPAASKNQIPTKVEPIAKSTGPETPPAELIAKLRDLDPAVRRAAIEEVGKFGPRAAIAVSALTKCLEDPMTSKEAAIALGRIGPAAKEAVGPIIRALDPDELERNTLQMILEKIDSQVGQKYTTLQQKRRELSLCESQRDLADAKRQTAEASGIGADETRRVYGAVTKAQIAVAEKTDEVGKLETELWER